MCALRAGRAEPASSAGGDRVAGEAGRLRGGARFSRNCFFFVTSSIITAPKFQNVNTHTRADRNGKAVCLHVARSFVKRPYLGVTADRPGVSMKILKRRLTHVLSLGMTGLV